MADIPIIREAVLADGEAISEVDRASHIAAYTPIFGEGYAFFSSAENIERWQRILSGEVDADQSRRWVLVACADKVVIAFARLLPSRDAGAAPGAGEVGALYVHPDRWRHGVGRVLLKASLDLLQQQGFTEATLWTLEHNASARAFYEAEGWADDGARQPLDVGRPGIAPLTEVRYRKRIGG